MPFSRSCVASSISTETVRSAESLWKRYTKHSYGWKEEMREEDMREEEKKEWEPPQFVKLVMPKPYAPEIDDELAGILRYVKYKLDRGKESPSIVHVDADISERFEALYDFSQVSPSTWDNLLVWKSEALPDDTVYIGYGIYEGIRGETWYRYYLVHLSGIANEVEYTRKTSMEGLMGVFKQEGQQVDTQVNVGVGPMLSQRSRAKVDAIASHYGWTIETVLVEAIDEYYQQMMPHVEEKEVTGE